MLLLGMVGFPDSQVVSTDTTVNRGDTTPVLGRMEEERYLAEPSHAILYITSRVFSCVELEQ